GRGVVGEQGQSKGEQDHDRHAEHGEQQCVPERFPHEGVGEALHPVGQAHEGDGAAREAAVGESVAEAHHGGPHHEQRVESEKRNNEPHSRPGSIRAAHIGDPCRSGLRGLDCHVAPYTGEGISSRARTRDLKSVSTCSGVFVPVCKVLRVPLTSSWRRPAEPLNQPSGSNSTFSAASRYSDWGSMSSYSALSTTGW